MKSIRRLLQLSLGLLLAVVLVAAFAFTVSPSANTASVQAAPLQQTTPEVEFSTGSVTLDEDAGSYLLTIQLDITSTNDVQVEIESLQGTAFGGEDYTTIPQQTITIPANDDEANFTLNIINDNNDEPGANEFFYVELSDPISATLGANWRMTVFIVDDDPTPTPDDDDTIYLDAYEPNNTLAESYTTSAGTKLCNITLWPTGDVDYFRFTGKAGSYYDVFTTDLDAGIDTNLQVFDTQGVLIASNDDFEPGQRRSQVTIVADVDGFYYARIDNRDPSDPTDKRYCFEIRELTPPTPTPSQTPIPGDSDCEFNSTIETACTIGLDQTYHFDFVPVYGSLQDTDIFRIWMKPGIEYTCESTIPPGSFADTNMIFLDAYGNSFQPNLGNDDKAFGDLGSKLSYLSTYTGWLHVMMGPVNVPPYEEAPQHTYDLICTATIATATPTATPTQAYTGGGGGFSPPVSTPTPIVFPTFPPTPTPIDLSGLNTPAPPTPPTVQFQALPTATPLSGGGTTSTINVTIYYDANENFMPELTEGVVDTAVTLYENSSGNLIAFGYTNEAGLIHFDSISSAGAVQVVVPFLNYTQIVTGESADILVRIAPQPLPVGIP